MIYIAGGVIWNPKRGVVVVSQHNNSWSLPKGHVEDGETELEAAIREIKEETGIAKDELQLISPLIPYTRERIKRNKDDTSEIRTITLFFFVTTKEILAPEDKENPEAIWVKQEDVAHTLSHPIDKEFFVRTLRDVLIPYQEELGR